MDNDKELIKDDAAVSAAVVNKEEQYHVVLPCSVENFGSFVSGLLGKPQVLKGEVIGDFEIGNHEIANVFHLVDHRVTQQNDGALIHLSITIQYNNGTSITHNDVDGFKNYHPLDDCHPIEAVMHFTYLLNFPNRPAPEKQDIEVVFSTEPSEFRPHRRYYRGALYEFNIEYTDRSWATDISGLLKGHGEKTVEKHSSFKGFMRRYREEVIEYTGILSFVVCLVFWVGYSHNYLDALASGSPLGGGVYINIIKYLIGSIVALSVLGFFVYIVKRISEYHLYIGHRSFIILTDRDTKARNKARKKERKQWLYSGLAWFSSIAAGLVVNYLNASGYFVP